MRTKIVWKGRDVVFTGDSYTVAKIYGYRDIFGSDRHRVADTRSDCCNVYLLFDDIPGAYNSRLFTPV